MRSVFDDGRALVLDPLLDRRATKLQSGVVDESLGYGIAQYDQTLQHHRQIHIRDRPITEKVVGASLEHVCAAESSLSAAHERSPITPAASHRRTRRTSVVRRESA